MQKIFIEKPYRFVPPMKSDWIARLMNNRLVHVPMLRYTESIVKVESRGADLLRQSVDDGDAVMLIPNHPRVSDPVVLYDLIRKAKTPQYAMASWHLFNQNWFRTAVIRMYGGYSVNREGLDRESINFSISAMQNNRRPLLVFPEGATSRTNDAMMPFLDGPTFIARTAARRRSKKGLRTVIHPIAIRYVFTGNFAKEFERLMVPSEEALNLTTTQGLAPALRVQAALEALVELKEREFGVALGDDLSPYERRQRLANSILETSELRCFGHRSEKDITNRIRDIRSLVFPELLANGNIDDAERQVRWRDLERTYLAWQMASYPKDYLCGEPSNDRILEIVGKIYEDLTDVPKRCRPQRVVAECCEAIEVPATKHRGAGPDPLIGEVREKVKFKLGQMVV